MSKECRTRILVDSPAEKDAFGSHERIAEAISSIVQSEDGGKAISLTGSWGVGKSTVITLLKSALNSISSDKKISAKVFIYDAWAHQGDSLRRSFLEELVKFITGSEGWRVDNNWKDDLDRIARRKDETITTTSPVLTKLGIIFLISIFLLPLGFSFFDTFSEQNPIEFLTIPLWGIGLFLMLAPLLIAVVSFIWIKLLRRGNINLSDILLLFANKSKEVNISTTMKTPDPTSIEFRSLFNKVLSDTLNTRNRKLVIAIDNLDRIKEDSALDIWATMKTFFERDVQHHSWLKHFWLLVPFDIVSIGRLWAKKAFKEDETVENNLDARLTTSFIDKTFQVNFHVSPPILSDRESFFKEQLEKAFPDHNKEGFHNIYRLFYRKNNIGKIVTPRTVKIFINRLGSLHRQWGDTIRLSTQALYVLFEDQIQTSTLDDFVLGFDQLQFLKLIDDPLWMHNLAGLHFNIEPSKAIHVLIEQRLEEALREGDATKFEDLTKVEGFLNVCENVIERNHSDWAEKESSSLALSALMLSSLETKSKDLEQNRSWEKAWEWLVKACIMVKKYDNFNEAMGSGLVAILAHSSEKKYPELVGAILNGISNTVFVAEENKKVEWGNINFNDVKEWVFGVLHVLKKIIQSGSGELIKEKFKIPGDASFYIKIMAALKGSDADKELIKLFIATQEPLAVIAQLSQDFELQANRNVVNYPSAVVSMLKIDIQWPWQDLFPAFKKRLNASNKLELYEIISYLKTMLILAHTGEIEGFGDLLKELSVNGHISHHLYHVSQQGDQEEVMAFCMLPILEYIPNGQSMKSVGNSKQGLKTYNEFLGNPGKSVKLIEKLTNIAIEFKRIESLINTTKNLVKTKGLMAKVLQLTLQITEGHRHLTSKILINNYLFIEQILGEIENVLADHITLLIREDDLVGKLREGDFLEEISHLYLKTLEVTIGKEHALLVAYLIGKLKEIEGATWTKYLQSEAKVFDLLIVMVKDEVNVDLGQNFHDALIGHAKGILDGQPVPDSLRGKLPLLLDALEKSWRQDFLDSLGDLLIDQQEDKPKEGIFAIYGDALIKSDYFGKNAERTVRRLFKSIIEKGKIKEIEWLKECLSSKPEVKAKAASKAFTDRVKDAYRGLADGDERKQLLEDIASILKLKLDIAANKDGSGTTKAGGK